MLHHCSAILRGRCLLTLDINWVKPDASQNLPEVACTAGPEHCPHLREGCMALVSVRRVAYVAVIPAGAGPWTDFVCPWITERRVHQQKLHHPSYGPRAGKCGDEMFVAAAPVLSGFRDGRSRQSRNPESCGSQVPRWRGQNVSPTKKFDHGHAHWRVLC